MFEKSAAEHVLAVGCVPESVPMEWPIATILRMVDKISKARLVVVLCR